MFIKLRAKRFLGRLAVQERGARLGDIFTQNTLTAIKIVCQVLDPNLCGPGEGEGKEKVQPGVGVRGPMPHGEHRKLHQNFSS